MRTTCCRFLRISSFLAIRAPGRVARHSRYADFLPDGKVDFLSEIAWRLSYSSGVVDFSIELLDSHHREICGKYGLPVADAAEVCREKESHTGIIVQSGYELYQFSHRTLQEYLAASFIVRRGLFHNLHTSFTLNPAPFAMAVSLSSEPSAWFSNMVLTKLTNEEERRNLPYPIGPFLRRLITEDVRFQNSEPLGFALLALEDSFPYAAAEIEAFVVDRALWESVVLAVRHYDFSERDDGLMQLVLIGDKKFIVPAPRSLRVRKRYSSLRH